MPGEEARHPSQNTLEVVPSRLEPSCAETGIVSGLLNLERRSNSNNDPHFGTTTMGQLDGRALVAFDARSMSR